MKLRSVICNRLASLSVAWLLSWAGLGAQSPEKLVAPAELAQAAPKPQFFAGTLLEISEQQVTVSRMLVGRPKEARVFRIDEKTKINRALVRVKARVTVRYLRLPEGDVALEIQPRPAVHARKP